MTTSPCTASVLSNSRPGSQWEYSNYGFILLGVVVANVSGESYYDYVREHIYQPAGMTASGSDPEDQRVPNTSIGYTEDKGAWRPNVDSLPYRGTSAGGGYTTVGDLLRFANALQNNTLLDAAHTQLLTEGKVDVPAVHRTTLHATRTDSSTSGKTATGVSGTTEAPPE